MRVPGRDKLHRDGQARVIAGLLCKNAQLKEELAYCQAFGFAGRALKEKKGKAAEAVFEFPW